MNKLIVLIIFTLFLFSCDNKFKGKITSRWADYTMWNIINKEVHLLKIKSQQSTKRINCLLEMRRRTNNAFLKEDIHKCIYDNPIPRGNDTVYSFNTKHNFNFKYKYKSRNNDG